jgi:hypothetical protein
MTISEENSRIGTLLTGVTSERFTSPISMRMLWALDLSPFAAGSGRVA